MPAPPSPTRSVRGGSLMCAALLLVLLSSGCRRPPDIRQVGGYVLVYRFAEPPKTSAADIERLLELRLRGIGLAHADVEMLDDQQVQVTLPGADAAQLAEAKRVMTAPGFLEFRILAQRTADSQVIAEAIAAESGNASESGEAPKAERQGATNGEKRARWVRYDPERLSLPQDAVVREGESKQEGEDKQAGESEDDSPRVLVLLDDYDLTGAYLATAKSDHDTRGQPAISGSFTSQGSQLMRGLTSDNLPDEAGNGRFLGIILDGQLLTAPRIHATVGGNFMITGNFTRQEADRLVAVLRAGRLPVPLDPEPVKEQRVQPSP